MNQIKVKTSELLSKLKTNRNAHRELFLKAQVGYRKAVIEELDRMLQEARDGKSIRRAIKLPEPQDHTEDYDTAIMMLEMSVEETLVISVHEFAQYVQDKWSWSDMVTTCNAGYAG